MALALDLTRAALQAAGNACPVPGLAIAFAIADQMISIAMTAKDNDGRLLELSRTVADLLLRLSRAMQGRWDAVPEGVHLHISEFNGQLQGVMLELKKQAKSSRFSSLLNANKRRSDLDRWEKRLLRAEQAFMLLLCIETSVTVNDLKTHALNEVALARNDPFASQFRRYASHLAQNLNGRLLMANGDSNFFAGGAWATFSQHYWEGLGLLVMVKKFGFEDIVVRRSWDDEGRYKKWLVERFVHQFRIRQALDHPNVVPLIGTCDDLGPIPCLVSPFYKYGTAKSYLDVHPKADRLHIILGVAKGLEYLHTRHPPVIHGDLRAHAILVDDGGNARISGFSWSIFGNGENENAPSVNEHSILWFAPEMVHIEKTTSFPADRGGTPIGSQRIPSTPLSTPNGRKQIESPRTHGPWNNTAMEVPQTEPFERRAREFETYSLDADAQLTRETDVWAFAMTIIELYSLRSMTPYRLAALRKSVRMDRRGRKPDRERHQDVPLLLWTVLEACWERDPARRPSASTLVKALEVVKEDAANDVACGDGGGDSGAMERAVGKVREVLAEENRPLQSSPLSTHATHGNYRNKQSRRRIFAYAVQ